MTVQPLAAPDQLATWRSGDPALLVPAAEGAVRSYCGWHIAPAVTETLVLDSPGTHVLLLPSMHVTAVSEVRGLTLDDPAGYSMGLYGEGNYGDPPVILDGWRATVTPRFGAGILERSPYRWPMGVVEVDLTHGYATVPADVRGVVLDLAEHMRITLGGTDRRQVGAVSAQVAGQAMTGLHRTVLDRYRLPDVP